MLHNLTTKKNIRSFSICAENPTGEKGKGAMATLENGSAKVIVYPSGAPVKFLKLRFRADMKAVESVYGDQWERSSHGAFLEWRSVMASRALAWFCFAKTHDSIACYGVKTGADCFAYWQIDPHGVTLFLNLCSGSRGVDLKAPLVACEVTELFSDKDESAYSVAKRFSKMLCDKPVLPKEPIFGVNNWYWAYGNISKESVLHETDYLLKMCSGTTHRPYMIIDDGWQKSRTYGPGAYIGGPWEAGERFGSMADTADKIHEKGAKCGIWFRPLLTRGEVPKEARVSEASGGIIMDPTHPYTKEQVFNDTRRIREWGYDLVKHDFTTWDVMGLHPLTSERHTTIMVADGYDYYDKTITTATAIKNLYKTIADGANGAEIIACNAIGHLSAGIHSIYRVGGDTSGRSFEWTRVNGVNSMMRLPQNDTFYRADPDCAAFTDRVDHVINLDFLEMCAITGVTTLASVTPDSLTPDELKRINKIFKIADKDECRYEIENYHRNSNPEVFVSADKKHRVEFNWESAYDGARSHLDWFN